MNWAHEWGRGDRRRLSVDKVPAEVLALVDARFGARVCEACRAAKLATPDDEPLELDHRRPLSRGGDNHFSNLRWLCRSHNRGRGARPGTGHVVPRWARGPQRP